jgi:cellulose biosynthesis protein BcsQ
MFPVKQDSQNFAQFLYYIQVNADSLAGKLEALKQYDPITKVHYMEPITNITDMEEMSGNAAETMLQTLISHGEYEYIIVDLDHSLHDRVIRVLSLSQHIIWLVLDDLNHVHKSATVFRELITRFQKTSPQWKEKIQYILNKYTGKISNDLAASSIDLSGHLPYVPQWKSVSSIEQLMSENAFHSYLVQWFFSIREMSRV